MYFFLKLYYFLFFSENEKNYFLKKIFFEKGKVSYYSDKFEGKKTASGDIFSQNKFTAAHRKLPIPSIILIIYEKKNKIYGLKVLVNDRGPYKKNRILDLSKKVFMKIDNLKRGVTNITYFFLFKDTFFLRKNKNFFKKQKKLKMLDIFYSIFENIFFYQLNLIFFS